jgi:hypothetical protein
VASDGQQLCECAYCNKVGTVHVRRDPEIAGEVSGFVCLGGACLPSGRLRALCSACTRGAVAAFARRADRAPGVVA